MAQTDLAIAGVGGQGSILAGVILGSAAVTFDSKYATQTQAYSSELRGGFAATWVIISDQPVEFPRVTHPDILVAQAADSITRFGQVVKPDGILIYDSDMVHETPAEYQAPVQGPGHLHCPQPIESFHDGQHGHAGCALQNYRSGEPQGTGTGHPPVGPRGQGRD